MFARKCINFHVVNSKTVHLKVCLTEGMQLQNDDRFSRKIENLCLTSVSFRTVCIRTLTLSSVIDSVNQTIDILNLENFYCSYA